MGVARWNGGYLAGHSALFSSRAGCRGISAGGLYSPGSLGMVHVARGSRQPKGRCGNPAVDGAEGAVLVAPTFCLVVVGIGLGLLQLQCAALFGHRVAVRGSVGNRFGGEKKNGRVALVARCERVELVRCCGARNVGLCNALPGPDAVKRLQLG